MRDMRYSPRLLLLLTAVVATRPTAHRAGGLISKRGFDRLAEGALAGPETSLARDAPVSRAQPVDLGLD